MHVCTHASSSCRRAEDDLVVAVALAFAELAVAGVVIRVGAAGVPAPDDAVFPAGDAGEVHGHVEAVHDGDVVHVGGVPEVELRERHRRVPGWAQPRSPPQSPVSQPPRPVMGSK